MESENYLDSEMIQEKYFLLFESLSEKDLETSKEQSKILIPYVREIVNRQQMRRIPTIIEGASIIPSTYFIDNMPISGFQNHVLFINLYLSDFEEHVRRRINRCKDRNYSDSEEMSRDKITRIRNSKNSMLHQETLALSKAAKGVYSLDIANMDTCTIIRNIQVLINDYLTQ